MKYMNNKRKQKHSIKMKKMNNKRKQNFKQVKGKTNHIK